MMAGVDVTPAGIDGILKDVDIIDVDVTSSMRRWPSKQLK